MIKNKKGLSAVVTTLMIILLVLVAVGIIWVVIRNVVETGTENIDIGSKCLAVSVKPVAYDSVTKTVTLERSAGGEAIDGVKIVFSNDSASGDVYNYANAIESLQKVTTEDLSAYIPEGANKVTVTAYFMSNGKEALCGQSEELTL